MHLTRKRTESGLLRNKETMATEEGYELQGIIVTI